MDKHHRYSVFLALISVMNTRAVLHNKKLRLRVTVFGVNLRRGHVTFKQKHARRDEQNYKHAKQPL